MSNRESNTINDSEIVPFVDEDLLSTIERQFRGALNELEWIAARGGYPLTRAAGCFVSVRLSEQNT